MPTECSPALFEFAPVEGRRVVAGFDGGAITSNAGALLLGATDRAIGLVRRFAACFRDARAPERIEHEVATLVGQRVFGIALGHEDLVDHDQLRHDPVLADPRRQAGGAAPRLRAAGRQEHAEPAGARARGRARPLPPHRPRRRGDRGAVRGPVPRRAPLAPRGRSSSTSTPPTCRCTGTRRAASSTATTTATATCRSTSSAAGTCWRPSSAAPTSTPRPARWRRSRASSAGSAPAGRGCASCCGPTAASPARR